MTFLPDVSTLLAYTLAAILLFITPGPDMTLFVSRTLSQGRAAGFASMAGALAGTLVHTTLVVVGISALIVASPAAFLVLKTFGAGYLVYLAYQAIRYGSAFSPETKSGPRISVGKSFSIGIGVNLLNPKVGAFYVAMLPQFIPAGAPHAAMGLLLAGVHVGEGLVWSAALIGFAALMSGFLRRPVVRRVLDRVTGAVIVAFGLRLALDR